MNEQLKDAVITIAGYDKGWTQIEMPITNVFTYIDTNGVKSTCRASYIPYTTSADALLDVWRKVNEFLPWYNNDNVSYAGEQIWYGNYEASCIELAEIIKQLKEKV